jgi:hypothetical protein
VAGPPEDESVTPDRAVSDDTVPDDTAPEHAVPDDTAPDDTAPDDTAPDDTAPDDTAPDEEALRTGLPPKVESWRRRSATGAILTGFALGLREAFQPERKEPAIIMQTSGEPPSDLPVEAQLEAVPARRTVVKIRPWLLDERSGTSVADPDVDPHDVAREPGAVEGATGTSTDTPPDRPTEPGDV